MKFIVIPIKRAREVVEDLCGDFIQEQMTDDQAREVLARGQIMEDCDPIAGEYDLQQLLAEFNGDIHSRFNSDNYYIYKVKGRSRRSK